MAKVRNVKTKSIITTGFPEVDNLLATLEPKLQKKAIRKGTRAGAKAVLVIAKRLVPIGEDDGGTLQDTLTVRTSGGTGKGKLPRGTLGHMVTHRETGDEDPWYSHFVEFGTVKWVGDPYIRNALYDTKREILAVSRKAIIAGVNEIAAKAKK